MEFLPEFYSQAEKGLCLYLAATAASYANMSMQMHLPWMLPKARTAYGKALQEVNGALKDKELVQDDGTLLAIILLCTFGVCLVVISGGRCVLLTRA